MLNNQFAASTRLVADLPFAELVQRRLSYIDSVELHSTRHFPREFVDSMRARCGSVWGPESFEAYAGRTKHRLWIHQPTTQAVEWIADHPCTVSKVHVSLDLITQSRQSAMQLHSLVTRHLMHASRPREEITQFSSTSYYNFNRTKGPRRNLVVYSDKTSKLLRDSSCTHIEMRVAGSKNLVAARIRSIENLLNLDHQEFWRQQIKLVDIPDPQILGALWCRHFQKNGARGSLRFPYGTREKSIRRMGHFCERMVPTDDSGFLRANDFEYVIRSTRILGRQLPTTLFRDAGISLILPAQGNALWNAHLTSVSPHKNQ